MGTHQDQFEIALVGLGIGQVHQPEGVGAPNRIFRGIPNYGPGDVTAARHEFVGQPEEVPVRRDTELRGLLGLLGSLKNLGRRL